MSAATEYAPVVGAGDPQPYPHQCPQQSPPSGGRRLYAVPDAHPSVRTSAAPLAAAAAGTVSDRAVVTVLHAPARLAPAAAPIRLTRRGVLVVAALVALVAGGLLWLAAASAPASGADAAPGGAARGATATGVTVEPGDTLWSIASRVAPERDPRAEVDALRRANRLTGVDLVPGQHLRVP